MTALNAVEVLDSKFLNKENCNDSEVEEGAEFLLEMMNSAAAHPNLIGCSHLEARNVQNLKCQHMFYSKDHTLLHQTENRSKKSEDTPPISPGSNDASDEDKSYIINIFLNDKKQEESQKDSVDVHVKNLGIKSNDVCVKKLSENIQKNYPVINKILQDIPEQNEERKRLVSKLEKVWGDVFKESVLQIPQATRNTHKKDLGMIQDRKVIQHEDPIVRAAQIDEAIKNNSLYKKQKRKGKSMVHNFDDRFVREDFEPTPIIADAPIAKKREDLVFNDTDLMTFEIEAPPMDSIVVDPVPMKKRFGKDTYETKRQEIASKIRATNRSQEYFDPINEPYPTMLEKDLVKEQLKKYKPSTTKLEIHPPPKPKEPETKGNVEDCKAAIAEENFIMPMRDFPRSEMLRPVPLVMGKRLKHYNKKTQDKIEQVVKLAAKTEYPKNTVDKMLNFWKGFFKFAREEDEQMKQEQKQENPKYGSYLKESSEDTAKKVDENDEEESIPRERKIAPMLRPEDVFGSQHDFQQRCGVRERILPPGESSFYKGGYRKFSQYTQNRNYKIIILRDLNQNYFDLSPMSYLFQRSYSSKDKKKDNKDPCSKVDEKAELKPCSSNDCKKGEKSRTGDKQDKDDCGKKADSVDEICEPYKCETDAEIDKIVAGEIGCTAKCLVNRVPDEKAKPEPIEPPGDEVPCDPRYENEVEPGNNQSNISQYLSQYLSRYHGFSRRGAEIRHHAGFKQIY